MLGSMKKCSNCHGTDFRRIRLNRTVQCDNCKLILEERCTSDLVEFHTVTQTEEVYCVVTPDFLHNHLVDDIPNDPYCTPGFISAFRMLSPLREPVYAASSRTFNGALAEMERLIGDALFAGYVGYNGRAPGGTAVKKEEAIESSERNKSGGDARHTLVAYFEIVELASILCVDKETTNLAIRIFRHTARNTSLRNRNVESLATAAFVSAAERRWNDYQEWLKEQQDGVKQESVADKAESNINPDNPENSTNQSNLSAKQSPWPVPPRHLSVEEISAAANLDTSEVLRYLKVVNVALRKQRSENNSSITGHMPSFCRRLALPQKTQNLAIGIAENALNNNICSRRNPVSVSAAAIYLACQLDGIRKTQTEICRITSLTEVTLRKVYKELNREQGSLLPEWYKTDGDESGTTPALDDTTVVTPSEKHSEEATDPHGAAHATARVKAEADLIAATVHDELNPESLVPPPLPPGFGELQSGEQPDTSKSVPELPKATAPAQTPDTSQNAQNATNPLLAMVNNPAMQAFAKAFSMMPQFMMPPPPPPLPPTMDSANAAASTKSPSKGTSERGHADESSATPTAQSVPKPVEAAEKATGNSSQPPLDMMAGMQSMMGMMQAMQAFQAMQQTPGQNGNAGPETSNPWGMMANMMTQAQQGNVQPSGASNPGSTATVDASGNKKVDEALDTAARNNLQEVQSRKDEKDAEDKS